VTVQFVHGVVVATDPGGTMMTMITTGALVYRPERVQFYCVAASGPRLAAVADLPHVASVVASFDTKGVNRLLPRWPDRRRP
jgi:DNA segregation ATPase FtsK/SpoIIIE-like protein